MHVNAYKVVKSSKTCPYSTFVKMVDADCSLEFQLNKLHLSKVTSTDEAIGRGAFRRVINYKVHMHTLHGTLCTAKEIHLVLVESASLQEFKIIRKSFYKECVKLVEYIIPM